jgi:hypothetical protein
MSNINTIVNWSNLIETGQIQEASPGEDYILVGSFDTGKRNSSTASRTREYMIKVSDFLANVTDLTNTVSAGDDVTIVETTNPDGSTDYEVTADVIPSNTTSSALGSPIIVFETLNPDGSTNYELNAEIPRVEDTNTWDLPTVAFVDRTNGNNSTAVIGDGNKPYSRVSSALAAGARRIILKPGVWPQDLYIQYDGVEIYAMQGVEFRRGIRLLSPAIVNFRLSGHAIFTGFQYIAFRINSMAAAPVPGETYGQIDIEFDYADNAGGLFFLEQDSASPKVNFSCDWAKTSGLASGAGYNVRCVGGMELRMDIKQFFYSQHTLYHCRNNFSGKFFLNCPDSRIIDNYTANYGNASRSGLWADSLSGAYIEFNGNLTSEYPVALASTGGALIHSDNAYFGPSKIVVNGDLHSVNNFCSGANYRAAEGEFEFNGDLTSGRLCIYDSLTGWGLPADQTYVFNGCIIDGEWNNIIGRGKTYYFKDCSFLVREDGSGLNPTAANIFIGSEPGSPASPTSMYLYNCTMESGKPLDPLIETFKNFSANFSIGTINTVSNIQIGTGAGAVDDWANFVTNPLLVTPKIR